LIELLVVIAIIGLLASIILVSLDSARTKSHDTARIADIRSIQNALALYANNNNGQSPPALSMLVTDGDIPVVPTDPNTGSTYAYVAYSTVSGGTGPCNNGYHIGALLENPPTVVDAGGSPKGSFRCSGSAYTGNSDCATTASCLAGSSGDFSGTGNVYDVEGQ
jgi:type II secretory pathway pseudopilin PulG